MCSKQSFTRLVEGTVKFIPFLVLREVTKLVDASAAMCIREEKYVGGSGVHESGSGFEEGRERAVEELVLTNFPASLGCRVEHHGEELHADDVKLSCWG